MTALLRNAVDSNRWCRIRLLNQGLTSILRNSPRRSFSSDQAEGQNDSSGDSFLQTPSTGFVYGRLFNITKHTTKRDILNLFDECKLSMDDVKVDYNRSYAPTSIMVQFPSRSAYDAALRTINKKGRLFRMERADRSLWDTITPFNGKAVLLQGIPRNALPDDVDRFLSGCEYDASSMQMFTRPSFPDPIRMAVVRFPSQAEAMHAFIAKNRSYCLNNQIFVRLLQ